jgi:hypothetical protein
MAVAGAMGLSAVAVAAFIWMEQTEPGRPLTANQQAALRADLLRQGVAPRDADLEVFERSGIDVRALPRVPLEIDYAPPSGSLGAAAAEAQVIMHVRIQKLAFEAGFEGAIYANLRAHVLNVLKDEPGVDAGDALWIRKAGGPERLPETSLVFDYFLGENEADPHLFEGDEAILFLEPGVPEGSWFVQARTGQYLLRSGSSKRRTRTSSRTPLTA